MIQVYTLALQLSLLIGNGIQFKEQDVIRWIHMYLGKNVRFLKYPGRYPS